MKSVHPSSPSVQPGRHLEILDEPPHDAQRDAEKTASPAVCTECGAVYSEGHWQWTSAPSHAMQIRCPACRRTAEGRAAAYVTISGQFAQDYTGQVEQMVRDVEHREKSAHPLRRVMAIEPQDGGLDVATTDVRLAHVICDALMDAYDGKLNVDYDEGERVVRVKLLV
ncbi:BCAM0308 family protein [Noviherbaspirillum denitrificans]|uniref:Nmd3 N-terminal domain-containing protein n=1 Tax=Noviherbaspirillum denitrificans TaxID=1968433 RepID=A0A254TBH8_9BURK|nr:BCAM0308 family protein [Noviherbaspirillum denitrificans]OWW18632.1 hypothetical protein AYR66_03320 [Noviherbaspirillum denitrificans]